MVTPSHIQGSGSRRGECEVHADSLDVWMNRQMGCRELPGFFFCVSITEKYQGRMLAYPSCGTI